MLEKYRDRVYRCIRCGTCRAKYDYFEKVFRVCPCGEHNDGFETDFPRGKLAIARGILDGDLTYTEDLAKVIFNCTLCANCRQVCGSVDIKTGKPLIDVPQIVKAMRADLFSKGVKVPEAVEMSGTAIEKTGNLFGADPEDGAGPLLADQASPKADTVYFIGCMENYRLPEVAQAVGKILSKVGIEFSLLGGEEHCCGAPLIMTGQVDLAKEVALYNCDLLKDKRIITSCAGCHRCFKDEYPKLLGEEYKINCVHMVEFLAQLIDEGKLKFKEAKVGETEKITYHDPCELGREMKIYDQPRKVITSIPGIELVEMVRNRQNTWCCGGGGALKASNNALSLEIGQDKVREILATGAKTVVSACPSCKMSMNDAIRAAGVDLRAIDITELVAEHLAP